MGPIDPAVLPTLGSKHRIHVALARLAGEGPVTASPDPTNQEPSAKQQT